MWTHQNKFLRLIKALAYFEHTDMGTGPAGTELLGFIGVNSEDVIAQDFAFVYVPEDDYEKFKGMAAPDLEYTDEFGQHIFIYTEV